MRQGALQQIQRPLGMGQVLASMVVWMDSYTWS